MTPSRHVGGVAPSRGRSVIFTLVVDAPIGIFDPGSRGPSVTHAVVGRPSNASALVDARAVQRSATTGRLDDVGVLGGRFLGPEVESCGQFAQVVA